MRVQTSDFLPRKGDLARCRLDHARYGTHGGGLASAIGANQGDNLSFRYLDGNTVKYLNLAITGLQIFNEEHVEFSLQSMCLGTAAQIGFDHCRVALYIGGLAFCNFFTKVEHRKDVRNN